MKKFAFIFALLISSAAFAGETTLIGDSVTIDLDRNGYKDVVRLVLIDANEDVDPVINSLTRYEDITVEVLLTEEKAPSKSPLAGRDKVVGTTTRKVRFDRFENRMPEPLTLKVLDLDKDGDLDIAVYAVQEDLDSETGSKEVLRRKYINVGNNTFRITQDFKIK